MTDFDRLELLLKPDFVKSYVNFSLRVHLKEGDSVRNPLASLFAGIQRSKDFRDIDITWADELLDNIPRTPQGQRDRRKEKRYVELSELETIPNQLQADRRKQERQMKKPLADQKKFVGPSTTHKRRAQETAIRNLKKLIAHMVMIELIVLWLIIWSWRGSNLCACRIDPDNNQNLYFASVSPSIMVDIPHKVQKIIEADKDAKFWQVYLSPQEHKTGRKTQKWIHTLFPSELVAYLETYL